MIVYNKKNNSFIVMNIVHGHLLSIYNETEPILFATLCAFSFLSNLLPVPSRV